MTLALYSLMLDEHRAVSVQKRLMAHLELIQHWLKMKGNIRKLHVCGDIQSSSSC